MSKTNDRLCLTDRGYCFDDILLVPCFGDVESRTIPDTSTYVGSIRLDVPIMNAPMDTIGGPQLACAVSMAGGLGVITRYPNRSDAANAEMLDISMDFVEQLRANQQKPCFPIAIALGCQYTNSLVSQMTKHAKNIDAIVLDVAHADAKHVVNFAQQLNRLLVSLCDCPPVLIAGSICTPEAASRYTELGIRVVRVGMGCGSVCTTRLVTGFGYPQLSALVNIARYSRAVQISDGGMRNFGDGVKAIWAGACAVMTGYMFAGCCEAIDPTEYRGMSSLPVTKKHRSPEGVVVKVQPTGRSAKDIVLDFKMALQTAMTLCGARNLDDLRNRAGYVLISPLAMKEANVVDFICQ